MEFEVLNLSKKNDSNKYENLLKKIPNFSPYYLPSFFLNFSNGLESLFCFLAKPNPADFILLPGYLRTIPGSPGYYDFSSPYGYSGPIFTPNISKKDLLNFWEKVDQWHLSKNVVSEFIRFSLNENSLGYTGEITPTLSNIKGKILTTEEQWQNFERKVRKNINRAFKENLESKVYVGTEISNRILTEFIDVYLHTMKRNNASDKFFYSQNVFRDFVSLNPEKSIICSIYDNEKCISTEFALLSDDAIFSFLGGTLEEGYSKRPNDLLKFNFINWCRSNGKKFYVLGGGYGSDDGIFKFKKSFFPEDISIFYTGRKIINPSLYGQIVKSRFEKNIPETSFFPLYRFSE